LHQGKKEQKANKEKEVGIGADPLFDINNRSAYIQMPGLTPLI